MIVKGYKESMLDISEYSLTFSLIFLQLTY